jgi:branched-chain amino acid transport system substrate-binding protein
LKGSHKLLRLVAVLGILVVVAAGCGREESGGDAGAAGEAKTVKIGFVGPLTGSLASLGLGMSNSIDLAVKQANTAKTIEGWNIVFDPQDDAGKPETGANAANKLASDPDMAGVIGTLQSSISQQVAPVLSRAKIAQISPANTNDTLTRGTDFATSPKRVWDTYFRLASLDSLQGPFGADYAYDQAGFKTAATVHDNLTYGKGLVATFTDQWKKIGGTITSANTIAEGDRDFGALVTKIVNEKPDFVYYGGQFPEAAPLSAQLKDRGFKGVVMGGDGMQADDYIKGGGSDGDLGTQVGAPAAKLPEAAKFNTDYEGGGYKDPSGPYGPLSYDSANVLIAALAKALPGKDSVEAARPDILKALQETSGFQGLTGTHSFDQYGDTSNKVFTVYKVEGKEWKDAFTGQFEA